MKDHHLNPFRVMLCSVPRAEAYFPREKLASELLLSVRDGEALLVAEGRRRHGKTALIRRTYRDAESVRLIYLDLWGMSGDPHLTQLLAAALALPESDDPNTEKEASWRGRVKSNLDAARNATAKAGLDPKTFCLPSVEFTLGLSQSPLAGQNWTTLLEAADAASTDKRLVIVLDEFQDVLKLPKKEAQSIIGRLRAFIQHQRNTTIVLSGSSRRLMRSMYADASGAFWKQVHLVQVGPMPLDFAAWIGSRFQETKQIRLATELIPALWRDTQGCVADLLAICAALWHKATPGTTLGPKDLRAAIDIVIDERAPIYTALIANTRAPETYANVLTYAALNCSPAGVLPKMTSRAALQASGLAAGSIKNCIDLLETPMLLLNRDEHGHLIFDDPFLCLWLLQRYQETRKRINLLS